MRRLSFRRAAAAAFCLIALSGAAAAADADIARPGDHTLTLEHGGVARQYQVHVPARYDGATPAPLLIALHGGASDMGQLQEEAIYGQIAASEREGAVVVFPNGFSRQPGGRLASWNGGTCCGVARNENVDDVGFLRAVVADVSRQLRIDRDKVFATGMSAGGIMAHRLACEMPDVVRAIASVAGTDNTRQCAPDRPVSVLMIHARDDDNVPFLGGRGSRPPTTTLPDFTSVPETITRWVQREQCSATPARVLEVPGARCERYSGCEGQAKVELCTTESGGHSWPVGNDIPGAPGSTALSANRLMWDFFLDR